ncbi:MAG: type II toxin-antitoxin system HicA family toxin [Chloroflexi bacterium]|nr:type II toxin-antitoxin system HicA family toxin [Chloroflexota bacterium]
MPRLRVFSGKELCDLLGQYGYVEVRRQGSHIMLRCQTNDQPVTVAVPSHPEITIGTLRSLIRQTRLPRSLFEEQR